MKFFKKFTCAEDERLTGIKNKVYKECSYLVVILCIISIFIKCALYPINIKSIITELVIIISSGIYSIIRLIQLGVYSEEIELYDKNHKTSSNTLCIIIGIACGIIISLYFGIRSSTLYGHGTGQRIWFFIIVFGEAFMIYGTFFVMLLLLPHSFANSVSRKKSEKNQDND